jgi:hypothetical protein
MLMLHSSDRLHHPPEDDDRSAVAFWLPKSPLRREELASAFDDIAHAVRNIHLLFARECPAKVSPLGGCVGAPSFQADSALGQRIAASIDAPDGKTGNLSYALG